MVSIRRGRIICLNLKNQELKSLKSLDDNRYGKFVVEPLERGYGTTLGNALRRVMLSSLPGIAVSSVKIKGALHEFTSIPGVRKTLQKSLNIKELHLKNNSTDNDPKLGYIEASGEGVVTAGDIKFDGDIEVLNPELVIANLSGKDARLDMTRLLQMVVVMFLLIRTKSRISQLTPSQ